MESREILFLHPSNRDFRVERGNSTKYLWVGIGNVEEWVLIRWVSFVTGLRLIGIRSSLLIIKIKGFVSMTLFLRVLFENGTLIPTSKLHCKPRKIKIEIQVLWFYLFWTKLKFSKHVSTELNQKTFSSSPSFPNSIWQQLKSSVGSLVIS